MNRWVQLRQRVIALQKEKREKSFFVSFLKFYVYTYVSWFVFLSLCLSLNVGNGFRLYYDSLYVRIRLCIVVVCLFRTEYLYECWAILSLIVRVYVCLLMPVSLWISVVVFLTLFLSECLYQCSAMLSLIVHVLVPLLIRVSLSFSLSVSIRKYYCRVYVRLSIRISLSLFLSECV